MTGGKAILGWLALMLGIAAPAASQPTFEKDIEPILARRCVPCHQPDGDAPFSLVTYADTRRHARQIADVTTKRYMPPWKPDLDSPGFVGDRRLREEDIAQIERWVEAGAPEGRSASRRRASTSSRGWQLGEPNLVLTLPTYRLRADGLDVFRNFVITVPGQGTRYVRGLQFRPRSRAVHHANLRLDATPRSRALDAADPEPGYEGMILHSADYPDGHFLGWTPGQASPPAGDLAWRLNGGTDFVVQLHMRPTGRVEDIAPLIGLYFTNEPPERIPAIVRLGRQNLDIAPGVVDHRVRDSFVVPVDAQVVAIQPHAHYRARQVEAWATLPNGVRRPLLHIGDWDFSWQDQYRLAQPMWLPAGTTLAMEYTFDNSTGNPRNPTNPPEHVSWGWRSSDEMGDVWIQVFTRNEADRETLMAVARRKMAIEDATGSEVLIAREPNYVNLRNDAALIYQELGQPERALEHFAAVSRLEPRSPAAHFNEGVALEALGRHDEAKSQYEESIRLDPSYARAHNNLANLLHIGRRLDEAATEYQAVLQFDPANIDARCNLGRVLTEANRPQEAVAQYRLALERRPESVACIVNFAWLLSAHRDQAIRRPAEAVALARRAVNLTPHPTAETLDVLSAAYASAGRFEEAIETETAALRLLESKQNGALLDEMRERLGLYQRHLPFLVPN